MRPHRTRITLWGISATAAAGRQSVSGAWPDISGVPRVRRHSDPYTNTSLRHRRLRPTMPPSFSRVCGLAAPTADSSECPAVGIVVRADGDGQGGGMIRIEKEHEAIRLVEAYGLEGVAGIQFLVPSPAGEVTGVQFVDHRGELALHGLREALRALSEGSTGPRRILELAPAA